MTFVKRSAHGASRRSLLVGVVTLVASAAFAVPTAAQSPNAAQKEPFLHEAFVLCETGAEGGVPTGSFAIIKKNPGNTVSTQVALKRALPKATYEVFLVQTPIFNPEDCFMADGTIQTNGRGNGNGHFSEPLASGQTGAFVYVESGGFVDFQATPNYVFGSK
jgi:hypothetical protein